MNAKGIGYVLRGRPTLLEHHAVRTIEDVHLARVGRDVCLIAERLLAIEAVSQHERMSGVHTMIELRERGCVIGSRREDAVLGCELIHRWQCDDADGID